MPRQTPDESQSRLVGISLGPRAREAIEPDPLGVQQGRLALRSGVNDPESVWRREVGYPRPRIGHLHSSKQAENALVIKEVESQAGLIRTL